MALHIINPRLMSSPCPCLVCTSRGASTLVNWANVATATAFVRCWEPGGGVPGEGYTVQWKLLITGAVLCATAGVGLVSELVQARQAEATAFRAEAEVDRGMMLDRTPAGTLRSLMNLISYAGDHGG